MTDIAKKLANAWCNPGINLPYHSRSQKWVRKNWQTLYNVIQEAIEEISQLKINSKTSVEKTTFHDALEEVTRPWETFQAQDKIPSLRVRSASEIAIEVLAMSEMQSIKTFLKHESESDERNFCVDPGHQMRSWNIPESVIEWILS